MPDAGSALRGAVWLAAFALTGVAAARIASRRADAFTVVWWALAVASSVGVVSALLDRFSLPAMVAGNVLTAVIAAAAGRRQERVAPADTDVRVSVAAAAAGLVTIAWAWPPFHTFLAGADSTMYLNAGIHLARTGSLSVPDTVAQSLPRDLATGLFPSIGLLGQGPFIRLPGGLLMESLDATRSTPAFFPLLPVWAAVLALIGGPSWVPAIAPIAMGLAVWAIVLFAGERLGIAAALTTAAVLIADFAVWWFGRFAMSEALTMTFVWGGLVFLGRREVFAAGVMLGLASLARTETLVFTIGALVWWVTWTRVPGRQALTLMVGLLLPSLLTVATLLATPSHHLAYLGNELAFAATKLVLRVYPALLDGRLAAAMVLLPTLPIAVAVLAAGRGRGTIVSNTLKATVAAATIVAVVMYIRLGDRPETLRHIGWLAAFMSPLALPLAVVGTIVLWARGGTAGRLAILLVATTSLVFLPTPHIAAHQPWGIRRFLPIVIPGLTIAVGAAVAYLLGTGRRAIQVAAIVMTLVIVAQEASPIFAARQYDYFADSLDGARRLADVLPSDAVVVVDSSFSELQIQVPLWLVYGRESVLATGGRPAWRTLLTTLTGTQRRVYWIQNRLAAPPRADGLAFTPIGTDVDINVQLPDAPADTPPTSILRRLMPLRAYAVSALPSPTPPT